MSRHKYDHGDAFCIMNYRCNKCGHWEKLWNSRDGVTPFTIGCPQCGDYMQHGAWHNDRCDPDYVPETGQRIFIDLTPELHRIYIKKRVELFWADAEYPMCEAFKTKAEAVNALVKEFKNGEPHVITI